MSDTTCHLSISLDGYVASPGQSLDDPLGRRGLELHRWHLGDERATDADAGTVFHFVTDGFDAAYAQATGVADGIRELSLEPVEVLGSPLATHIRYRVL